MTWLRVKTLANMLEVLDPIPTTSEDKEQSKVDSTVGQPFYTQYPDDGKRGII